jgi:hypothetical protein
MQLPHPHTVIGLLAAFIAGAGCAAWERRSAASAKPEDAATEDLRTRHRAWRRCIDMYRDSSLSTLSCGDEPVPSRTND